MPSKGNVIKLLTISICLLFNRCIEPVEPQAIVEFENILVIDATITDELKQQKIVLSRTFSFEDEGSGPETNAQVTVVEDGQNEITFQEAS
ncbi:MAG TPA: DUF4249 family protein, partial [Eudoraea sp.]|nr:DUF4249 family protein [Eudoraea sp.]